MPDMTQADLEQAVESSFDDIADQVFDGALQNQLETVDDPAAFTVTSSRLQAASKIAFTNAPENVRIAVGDAGTPFLANASVASLAATAGPTVNSDAVLAAADDDKKQAAADGIKQYLCGKLKDWFEQNLDQVKQWLQTLGIKGTLKQIWSVAKQLVLAAIGSIAAVVGSTFLAYLLIAVAVAAVGAAIYFVVKNGVPNYCAT